MNYAFDLARHAGSWGGKDCVTSAQVVTTWGLSKPGMRHALIELNFSFVNFS